MSDDYLWDRSGKPDEEVVRLEELLSQFKLSPRQQAALPFPKPRRVRWWAVAAAAALAIGAIGITVMVRSRPSGPVVSWQLSVSGEKPTMVRAGQMIQTSGQDRATLESEFVGNVDIAPDSRLRVLSTHGEVQQLALDHGTIHALIWAPPTRFAVDTPWAKAIDLGCQYTLHVDTGGNGLLTVETGWVAFQWKSLESFIPAGAACRTHAGSGPGTPYFLDAPSEFVAALQNFDSTPDSHALDSVLTSARGRDALTLWHLLRRTQGREREQVFDRFSALVTLPHEASRAAVIRGDSQAIDAAWNALNLGDTHWWREWKRAW